MGQQATLIMEAYGHASFTKDSCDYHVWSRLYRAENIFIDISLEAQNQEITLSGQVLEAQQGTGHITLLDDDKQLISQTVFMEGEAFYLTLTRKGSFGLRVELDNGTILIPLAIA